MMRKHTAQQMKKVSISMPEDEYREIVEESDDMSLNLYVMRLVRKARAEEKRGELVVGGKECE
jgi:hypothetical protein